MGKMCKSWLAILGFFCLFIISGCQSGQHTGQDPANFIAEFTAVAETGDEKALAAYKGNTYRLNVEVDGVVFDQYIHIRCTNHAKISAYVPAEDLDNLKAGCVVSLEGTVKEVKADVMGDIEMTMDPAHVVGDVFEIIGEVEEIFHDWDRGGQDYAAIWDSSVIRDRQINVYLPEGHNVQVGDRLSAQGALVAPLYPEEFTVAYIRGRETADVFVMPEPDMVQKVVEE